jgi:hypothetical protein
VILSFFCLVASECRVLALLGRKSLFRFGG